MNLNLESGDSITITYGKKTITIFATYDKFIKIHSELKDVWI